MYFLLSDDSSLRRGCWDLKNKFICPHNFSIRKKILLTKTFESILAVLASGVIRKVEAQIKEDEEVINLFLVQCWRDHKYSKRAEEVILTANHSALTSTEEEVPGADQHAGQDPHVLLLETTQLLHTHQ